MLSKSYIKLNIKNKFLKKIYKIETKKLVLKIG